jgi:hypothetical protein
VPPVFDISYKLKRYFETPDDSTWELVWFPFTKVSKEFFPTYPDLAVAISGFTGFTGTSPSQIIWSNIP